MSFEHKLVSIRGQLGEEAEAQVNALAAEGWAVVASHATTSGVTVVHHFVLRRELTPRKRTG